ncbi:DUF503 domain-containing protein [Desulfoplanes sp. PS50]|jgi:uncharacterized protein YlxP (DUF503 family)
MIIGILQLEFRLHEVHSLKEKRRIANSLKQKLKNKFNVAVSEVDNQNSHDRLVLAAVTVSNETQRVQSLLSKAVSMIEASTSEELVDTHLEIFGA